MKNKEETIVINIEWVYSKTCRMSHIPRGRALMFSYIRRRDPFWVLNLNFQCFGGIFREMNIFYKDFVDIFFFFLGGGIISKLDLMQSCTLSPIDRSTLMQFTTSSRFTQQQ